MIEGDKDVTYDTDLNEQFGKGYIFTCDAGKKCFGNDVKK